MDDQIAHPDDATLFDLLEGALEPAREQAVVAHLERCAACAAFMDAARAGAPETTTAVVTMPDPAATRMHLRLADDWRARVAAIGAAEAREDAAAPAPAEPAYLPLASSAPRPRRRRGSSRVLVPSLAAAVLAVLAGTSIWIGDDAAGPEAGSADQQSKVDPSAGVPVGEPSTVSGTDETVSDPATAGGTASPAAGAPEANEISGAEDRSAAGAEGDVGTDIGVPIEPPAGSVDGSTVPLDADPGAVDEAPPVGYDELVGGQLCIAVFDPARLVLPDGRIAQQVLGPGPYGMYLVCG